MQKTPFSTPHVNANEDTRIAQGSQVWLHFEVSLENGTVIDSTFNRSEPVHLVVGDESLLPGFEQVLMQLRAGDTRTAHLPCEQAFGEWNPDNLQTFYPSEFAQTDQPPEVGMMMSFEDKNRQTLTGVISKVSDTVVEVDFNHPLAGNAVLFKVHIIKVLPKGVSALKLS